MAVMINPREHPTGIWADWLIVVCVQAARNSIIKTSAAFRKIELVEEWILILESILILLAV
jgi:hypothetical protein